MSDNGNLDHLQSQASLFKKMALVMGELKAIPKEGVNKHFDYKFATASDVSNAIRVAMSKHNLAFIPCVLDRAQDGKTTKVKMLFTLGCGDTGATYQSEWFGEAQDSGDKGFNKAVVSAVKYFLMKTFLISTEDETDPDADETTQAKTKPNSAKDKPTFPDTTSQQWNEWAIVVADEFGKTVAEASTYLEKLAEKKAINPKMSIEALVSYIEEVRKTKRKSYIPPTEETIPF